MEFCNSPLWDWNQTWYSSNPDFTPCFEQTVLAWTPLVFLWIFFGLDLHACYKSSHLRNISWNFLNSTKVGVTYILILTQVISLVLESYLRVEDATGVSPVQKLTPNLRILTFGLVIFLVVFCKSRGIRTSVVQFLFWFLMVLCEAFGFRTAILMYKNPSVSPGFIIPQLLFYPFVLVAFLLNCWSDAAPSCEIANKKLSPESTSPILSKLFFAWFEKIVWKGYRKPLEPSDLWDLNPEDRSCNLVPIFENHWNRARQKHLVHEIQDDNDTLIQHSADNNRYKKSKFTSIVPTLVNLVGGVFLRGAVFEFLNISLAFISPQILKLLISYIQDTHAGKGGEPWKGYLYAVLLFAAALLETLLSNQYFIYMLLGGLRFRSTLMTVIYNKALRISSSSRKDFTTGEIVNLLSVDLKRFMDMFIDFHLIWSSPLQIGVAIYFLWGVIGPSVLAGLAVMVLLIPVNYFISEKYNTIETKQMELKDKRVKQTNEMLSGIKVLKLQAWEESFAALVMETRNKEMKLLVIRAYLDAVNTFIWNCAPFMVALASFGCFVLSDPKNVLDPQTAFVALALFNILRLPIQALPYVVSALIQANVSLKRLNKFMNAEELDPNAVTHDPKEKDPIVIENGFFSWDPEDENALLKNINLKISQGSLVAICGTVGSGKSSILSAILGEMFKKSGRVNTIGSCAYVPQQAWIQNASVRDNILFGLPFNAKKYDKVITACALKPDLEILSAGDRTEIGEKGINISGGQKQRISLARAVYSDADLYLLDDPLSAVDAHVGKQIFDQLLGPNGLLKTKTRVFVTHAITYLPKVDKIVVVTDGAISETGTYRELLDHKGAFADFLVKHITDDGDGEDESPILHDLEEVVGVKIQKPRKLHRTISERSEGASPKPTTWGGEEISPHPVLRRRHESISSNMSKEHEVLLTSEHQIVTDEEQRLIEDEEIKTGGVSREVYFHYLRSIGWGMTFMVCVAYVLYQGVTVISDFWLSIWSNANTGININGTVVNGPNQAMYFGVYGALGVGQGIGILVASMIAAYGTLRASNRLHKGMLDRIIKAPMSFFDTVPLGRLVNRFSSDVNNCDKWLGTNCQNCLSYFLNIVAVLVVISYSTPIFLTVILPIGIVYYLVQRMYIPTSRQLRRLESVTRSPIYSHLSETVSGSSTIRAYAAQQRFSLESESRVDANQLPFYPSLIANRWLAVRLETLGNFVIFFAALFAVIRRETMSPGLVGLSITYALEVTGVLNWMVRLVTAVETDIVAVERIQEYSSVSQEAWDVPGKKSSEQWPVKGEIVFQDYQTRYREGLDLVLRGVNCRIKSGEKVGVVGRTGAGKSSLALALFRIIEPVQGTILIDDEDISKMSLRDLRSGLTIIPQDPVMFSGSLRVNLDPLSQYSDEVIWRSLELAHLKTFVLSLPSGLEHDVAEGGENLSVGQRQLICLARALLRKTRILVLDEATAAVDLETDNLIQQTIRTEFNDCTIVTIAHRLNTIMDSTRVIVMDNGEIREFDTPSNLMANTNSIFYGMAKDAGLVSGAI